MSSFESALVCTTLHVCAADSSVRSWALGEVKKAQTRRIWMQELLT